MWVEEHTIGVFRLFRRCKRQIGDSGKDGLGRLKRDRIFISRHHRFVFRFAQRFRVSRISRIRDLVRVLVLDASTKQFNDNRIDHFDITDAKVVVEEISLDAMAA